MAQKDMVSKLLEDHNDVFADILNGLLFDGKKVIDPMRLSPSGTESIYKVSQLYREQRRDIIKNYFSDEGDMKFIIAGIGFENESATDKNMPVRVMSYDAADYKDQIKKSGTIYPLITVVLNFSQTRWNTACDLYGMMNVPDFLKPFVQNYSITVVDMLFLEDSVIDRLESDIKIVVRFLKNRMLGQDAFNDRTVIKHVEEVLDMLSAFTRDNAYRDVVDEMMEYQNEKGEVTMCELAQGLISKGRAEGRAEGFSSGESIGFTKGRAEGFSSGESVGFTKGRAEGFSSGESVGFTKGKSFARLNMLEQMINMRLPRDTIFGLGFTETEYNTALQKKN